MRKHTRPRHTRPRHTGPRHAMSWHTMPRHARSDSFPGQYSLDLVLGHARSQEAVAHFVSHFLLGLFFLLLLLGGLLGLRDLPPLYRLCFELLALLSLGLGLALLLQLCEFVLPDNAFSLSLFILGFLDCDEERVSICLEEGKGQRLGTAWPF